MDAPYRKEGMMHAFISYAVSAAELWWPAWIGVSIMLLMCIAPAMAQTEDKE